MCTSGLKYRNQQAVFFFAKTNLKIMVDIVISTLSRCIYDYIKNTFDELFEPDWQIVIGKDFSAAFSFEIENFVFFQIFEICQHSELNRIN